MIERDFFRRSPLECSRDLIGAILRWGNFAGSVVETEAYDSEDDPACHTFFRPSTRKFVAMHDAGAAYVYLNYGMHWMLNVLVKGSRSGFVLIRALHPREGIEEMQANRGRTSLPQLCSGPGKLTQAFAIRGEDHGRDLCSDPLYAFHVGLPPQTLQQCPRVGISAAIDYPWRFVAADSPHLSVPPLWPSGGEESPNRRKCGNGGSRTFPRRKRPA